MKIPYRTKTKIIDLAKIKFDDICAEDIACSLAGQARFNGITRPVYSVAQHSVLCSYMVQSGYELEALLHDAHEYIIGDIPGPVQSILSRHTNYDFILALKNAIDVYIGYKFACYHDLDSAPVMDVDKRMLATEMKYFFGTSYLTDAVPYHSKIIEKVWTADQAERFFLDRLEELTK